MYLYTICKYIQHKYVYVNIDTIYIYLHNCICVCIYGSFSSLWPICPVFSFSSPWGPPCIDNHFYSSRVSLCTWGNAHVCGIFLPTQKLANYMHSFEIWHCHDDKEEVARINRRTVQKDLHDPDNHDDVITHLEPDILECEVKWALGNITTNKVTGGDGILVEPFQILKDGAVKVLHSIYQQIWKTQQWSQDWKRSVLVSFHSNPKEQQWQRMFKLPHNCILLTL